MNHEQVSFIFLKKYFSCSVSGCFVLYFDLDLTSSKSSSSLLAVLVLPWP